LEAERTFTVKEADCGQSNSETVFPMFPTGFGLPGVAVVNGVTVDGYEGEYQV